MRSILEKALIALLNEEKDKADALFHDFILERSRQIHESLRQGEDFVLDESWEQELSIDEMFTEADLADDDEADAVTGDEAEVAADDATADAETADAAADDATDAAATVDSEEQEDDRPIEDRVEDLEAQLQALVAEFDAAMGVEDDGMDVDGDVSVDTDGVDTDAEVDASRDDLAGTDTDEDQFESLGESVVDELETVAVDHAEGKTTGDKQKVDTAGRVKNIDPSKRQAGEPVEIKAEEHNGFDREASPKVGALPKGKNTLAKADDGRKTVKKEGDGAALLNKGGEDKSAQKSLFDKKRV